MFYLEHSKPIKMVFLLMMERGLTITYKTKSEDTIKSRAGITTCHVCSSSPSTRLDHHYGRESLGVSFYFTRKRNQMEAFGDSSICRTNIKASKLTCQKTEVSCGDKTRLNPRNLGILSLSPVILELY